MDNSQALLVVEDTPNILEVLEITLRFKGYEVLTAHNGQEALDVIKEKRPALVISDILMPKMDGFSLIYRLREDPETRDIPVMFLSATYIAPEDKDFAKTLGVTKFIEKPIDTEDFLKTVAEILKQGPNKSNQPITEHEFFVNYEKRLELKLSQKKSQISRIERLLETVPSNEKQGFEITLKQALVERQSLESELEQVRQHLQNKDSQ